MTEDHRWFKTLYRRIKEEERAQAHRALGVTPTLATVRDKMVRITPASLFGADEMAVVLAELASRTQERDAARAALQGLLVHYVDMVNSGDCGFWDPEIDDVVIAARRALGDAPEGA